MSIEHQVLCNLTAIVGVSKQTEKATGMLIETQIKFGKEILNSNSDNFGPQLSMISSKVKKRKMDCSGLAMKSMAAPAMTRSAMATP